MDERAWIGDNPFYLMFIQDLSDQAGGTHEPESVDLDEPGWMATKGHIFRTAGSLFLIRKSGREVIFSVHLDPGDQGYYTARHIGIAGSGGAAETIAYGIGKKRYGGNEDNLWILPWGQVCGGNDVEHFALEGLKKGL